MKLATNRLVMALALAACVAAPVRADEWKAVLRDKNGNEKPLPEKIAKMNDKEWLQVGYTAFAGYKPRVGVVFSDYKTQEGSPELNNDWAKVVSMWAPNKPGVNPLNHVEDVVRQALGATNRFTMIERTTALGDVEGEQDYGASGRVDKKTAVATGKMKGADFLVKATIIEFDPEKESKSIKAVGGGIGASTLGIASIGVSGTVAFCRINVRLVNSTTGEITQDMTVDGTAKSSGVGIGGGLLKGVTHGMVGGGVGFDSEKKATLTDALQACANKIAYFTTSKLEDQPWQGAVANINGSKLMINAGTNVGLKEGLTLKLMSKGEAIVDPDDSTSVLGYDSKEIGALKIVSVQEKFSTCEIVTGGEGVKKGDLVVLERHK